MQTIDVDGARLSYLVEGEGEPALAFAHGWCSRLDHWDAQADAFRGRHRVVRWDRRGMGRSQGGVPADSPARHADDLVAILDAESIERVVIVGHAGGGPSAIAFAARHPGRARGLVLVDTGIYAPPAAGSEDAFATGIAKTIERITGPDGDERFRRQYTSYFGPRAAPAIVEAAVANALAVPREVAAGEVRHMLSDTVGWAGQVTCPVLWVSAQPTDTARVKAAFADVAVGHVVGSGHFVQVEVPEQLNPMIEVFVGGLAD